MKNDKKRFTYQHQNQQYTLFYYLFGWDKSNWAIGLTNAFAAGQYIAEVHSVVLCPEQITETEWTVYNQYYPSYIQIQCYGAASVGGAASEASEFKPDGDISDLNDTESSPFNYAPTFDMLPNEVRLKMTLRFVSQLLGYPIKLSI